MDQPLHLLVADDHLVNQILVRALLEAMGHRVDVVSDGRRAVEAVGASTYDLVLMDMRMPEMDGLAATRAIRALPAPAGTIPILALTANSDGADIRSCRAAGMNGFLPKPVSSAELARAIASVLEGHGAPASGVSRTSGEKLFDRSVLDRLAEDLGPGRLPDMLEKIGAETARRLVVLRRLAQSGEPTAIQFEAHALKGTAATVGLVSLAALAKRLERDAATLAASELATAIDEVEAAYGAGWPLVTANSKR